MAPTTTKSLVTLGNLGIVQEMLGRLEEAEATQVRALTIKEDVYGPNHHEVAVTLGNLGIVQERLGRSGEAEATTRRAWQIFTDTLGPDHPNTQQAKQNLDQLNQQK